MITKLTAVNFKSLHHVEVELGQLSVLVGPNGCGKSTVLQAITIVRDFASKNTELTVSVDYLTRSKDVENCVVGLEWQDTEYSSGVAFKLEAGRLFRQSRRYELQHTVEFYRLDRRFMELPAYTDETHPTLGSNGENLAEVLDALHGDRPERFEEIEDALRDMVPGFRRLRIPRRTITRTNRVLVNGEFHSGTDQAVGHQVVFDFDHAKSIVAEHASEGTLLLLGLLTILATHDGPMTMMLDDLDRALHPKAQKLLVEHLRQLLAERPNLQIIATSHSPYLVEHLEYEEVLAMTQDPTDGSSYIAPLLDHPDAERWREEMSAGEFWSSVGEDWVRKSKAG